MNTLKRTACLPFFLAGFACLPATNAAAELRCDCSQIVEACSASVSLNANRINIESDNQACSRVDYLVDGQPFTALVVDGKAEFSLNGQPLAGSQIIVENCRVCSDSTTDNAAADASANNPTEQGDTKTGTEEESVRPVVKVMPNYPRSAWGTGLEGRVTVEFDVSEEGIVQNIRVISSSNQVFIDNALDAVSRFRYTPKAAKGLKEEFRFALIDGSEPSVTSNPL